jgi:transcriptional regulator with XRE-family HTH domain
MTAAEHDRELIALGRAIREVRAQRGMEPGALAAAAGIERKRLDAIEDGRFDPTYDVLLALADALGIEPAALVIRAGDLDKSAVCVAFGRRLWELRAERSVSQDRLSSRAGIHRTAIGKMERGGSDPRLTTILRLARGLDVLPGALVEGLAATRGETE